jgi:L-fuconate dehydratase
VTLLQTDQHLIGTGLALTRGLGNDLVCRVIEALAEPLVGREIEALMAEFGQVYRQLANHPQLRWLGPHKGVVHLALASITNACFDLWAKSRGRPLWRLLLDLSPAQIIQLLDFSYVDDVLNPTEARAILQFHQTTRAVREPLLRSGYPSYGAAVGWFHDTDEQLRENARRAVDAGFNAMKLKVGSQDGARDLRRVQLIRETVGPGVRLMLDVNQRWSLAQALRFCQQLGDIDPYWLEEPTHPDDVLGHQTLARAIYPIPIAVGEHVPNVILFKNYLLAGAAGFIQVDCVRVGGISEFLLVSLLARKFNVPVVPHVGDMGQIHQHLVLFNHIALEHPVIFLEYIPQLRAHFKDPAQVTGGTYRTPTNPGSSSDLN